MVKWTESDKPPSTWGDVIGFSPDGEEQEGKATVNLGSVTFRIVSSHPERVKSVATILQMVHAICGDEFDVAKLAAALGGKK